MQVFCAVAQYKSATKAAEHLHMTQPAVSNIIRQLEDYYGCTLVETIGRQLSITLYGKALLKHYIKINETVTQTEDEIASLKGALTGTICVATVSTAKYFTPYLLEKFRKKHKNVSIKLVVGNRGEIMNRLHLNKDDFVIMSHPPRTMPVDIEAFYDDELLVVSAPHNTLSQSKSVNLKALNDAPWIIREEGSGTRFATERVFHKKRFYPHIEMEIGDNEAIKQAVIANLGISVLSKQSIKVELKDKLISTIDVKGFPIKHTWFLVKNKRKELSPISKEFYRFVST